MKQRTIPFKRFILLLVFCLLFTGCGVQKKPTEDALDFREYEMFHPACIEYADDYGNYPKQLEQTISDQSEGFLGTIVPISHRFYLTYERYGSSEEWRRGGYADVVCEITDLSDVHNNTDYRVGDRITVRIEVQTQFLTESEKEYIKIMKKIGVPYDWDTKTLPPLTEEEQKQAESKSSVTRTYPIPVELLNPKDMNFALYSEIGILFQGVAYDALVRVNEDSCYVRYAYAKGGEASGAYDDRKWVGMNEEFHSGFGTYLAEHRAELGLSD